MRVQNHRQQYPPPLPTRMLRLNLIIYSSLDLITHPTLVELD